MGSKSYRGYGGPPPPESTKKGGGYDINPFEFRETLGDLDKSIKPFFLQKGETTNVTILDKGGFEFSVMLHHRFHADGHYNNYAVCRSKMDEKGCPLCDAKIGDPRWFLVGSLIDSYVWKFDDGREYTDLRRLLLIHRGALEEFEDMEVDEDELVGGNWRGVVCKIKRADGEKAARIGTKWRTKKRLTEAQLIEKYEEVADGKEIPVEAYIAPVDYETVLAPYSYEDLVKLADGLAPAVRSGSRSSYSKPGKPSRKQKSKAHVNEDEVPF